MKFSVVIPAYDQQEYLMDAIESALNQTKQPHEVIVVVDGSPDHSKEIAERYPVKIINQVNKGLSAARNSGIMASSFVTDVILPLDADDILMDNCIEKMDEVFSDNDVDIVAPSFKCFGEANDTITLMQNPTIDDFRTANRIGYFSAIKKEALIECGGYSPRMTKGYEDYHLWFDLLTRGKKIITIQEPLVLYRTKERSMWKDTVKYHHKDMMNQIFKDFPNVWPKK